MGSVSPAIAERIRRPMPVGLSVLPGSLPVVAFGDPNTAGVATLSLNPSWLEFQSPSGAWLRGHERRLASLISLGANDPRALDDDQVAQVVAESNAYFRGPNWYKGWFHWLGSLLETSGVGSYLDGSACHLDLVQWATKPAQGDLQAAVWERLVEQDHDFLRWQLGNSNLAVVLLNGMSVVHWVKEADLVSDFDEDVIPYQATNGNGRLRIFRTVADGVTFVGWNRPVAGALAADGRHRLSQWLALQFEGRVADAAPREKSPQVRGRAIVSANVALVNGFVPAGTQVDGALELGRLLSRWLEGSNESTVGDVGAFGGSPVIIVRMGSDEFVLNRDTKRAAVQTFLAAAAAAGGAQHLNWHVTANRKGTINRVSYRPDEGPTPGWYAYLRSPSPAPRELG